jgi:hypothetical protein
VTLNGIRYATDLAGFIRRPLDQRRDLQDQGAEPSESTLKSHNTWKRTGRTWDHGAGQDWFDEVDSNRARFRASKGVDIWDERKLTLLPSVSASADIWSNTPSGAGLKRAGGSYVYGFAETNGFRLDAAGTYTNCTGESGDLSDITVWDGYVYFAHSTATALQRVAVGSTALSTFGSLTPDLIEVASGRLLAAEGSALYEINAAGAKQSGSNIFDHPATNWTWSDLEGAPNGIYVAGDDGYTSTVLLVPVTDATGDLVAPYPVLSLPPGEIVRSIVHLSGLIGLSTSRGVRLCSINGSGFLGMGPLLELGDVAQLTADGDYLYATWSAETIDGHVAVARISPGTFVEPFLPAYACDLAGSEAGTMLSVAVLDGQVFALYTTGSATYILNDHATVKRSTGVLYSGGISYVTPEDKRYFGLEGVVDPLPAGSSVVAEILDYGDASSEFTLTMDTTAQTSETGYDSTPMEDEAAEIKLTLNRATDTTTGPVVRRWSTLATPIKFPTEEIILAIILKTTVAGDGADEYLDIDAEWSALHTLFLTQERVSFTFGSRTETVTVDAVAIEPSGALPGLVDWDIAKDWPEGVWYVRLLTQEA